MKVSIRSIAATAFVALLVPLAAVAKESEVNGPAALAGKGCFGGELTMTLADGRGRCTSAPAAATWGSSTSAVT